MKPIEEAAQLLIRQLNLPANRHAIWIRSEVGDDDDEARTVIMVARNPVFGDVAFPQLPENIMGVPVRSAPWQPDDVRDHPDWHARLAEIARA